MKTVQDYLDHADGCEKLARHARSTDERQMIADMTETWRMLAYQRRVQLAKKARNANLI